MQFKFTAYIKLRRGVFNESSKWFNESWISGWRLLDKLQFWGEFIGQISRAMHVTIFFYFDVQGRKCSVDLSCWLSTGELKKNNCKLSVQILIFFTNPVKMKLSFLHDINQKVKHIHYFFRRIHRITVNRFMFIYNWLAKWRFKDCSQIICGTMALLISNVKPFPVLMLSNG